MAQEETETTGQAEAAQAQAKPEGEQQKGGPDWQRAAQDYKAQRDEARRQVADLTGQLDRLRTDVEGLKTADDVKRAVDEALAKARDSRPGSPACRPPNSSKKHLASATQPVHNNRAASSGHAWWV